MKRHLQSGRFRRAAPREVDAVHHVQEIIEACPGLCVIHRLDVGNRVNPNSFPLSQLLIQFVQLVDSILPYPRTDVAFYADYVVVIAIAHIVVVLNVILLRRWHRPIFLHLCEKLVYSKSYQNKQILLLKGLQ